MLESQNRYLDISREYMGKAREYLAANDYKQASEKGWGATAEMVKAVARRAGLVSRQPPGFVPNHQ